MSPDFLDLLRAFSVANARFLVVGAYAVGVHGRPRATKDLDVWVEPGRIDVLTQISGIAFDEAWPGRVEADFGDGVRCSVIGLDALLLNKRASARPQDLADVDALERLTKAKKR